MHAYAISNCYWQVIAKKVCKSVSFAKSHNNCDRVNDNKAYLQTRLGLLFELQLTKATLLKLLYFVVK